MTGRHQIHSFYAKLLLSCTIMFVGLPTHARRIPPIGGELRIALPQEEMIATQRKHLYVPILEPVDGSDWLRNHIDPPLTQFPKWRSSVLSGIRKRKDGKMWTLISQKPLSLLAMSLASCFEYRTADPQWPSWALRALKEKPAINLGDKSIRIQFKKSMDYFPGLLAGCLYSGEKGKATGPYALLDARTLALNSDSPRGPSPITRVHFLQNDTDDADITGSPPIELSNANVLVPFSEVVLLLQKGAVLDRDPLGTKTESGGLRAFRDALRASDLLDLYWAGKGNEYAGILPPGIGPPRPLPQPTPGDAFPLRLNPLPADAPSIAIGVRSQGALPLGVLERIAVILRSKGYKMIAVYDSKRAVDMEIVKWRAPVRDPALALLVLAGQYPNFFLADSWGEEISKDRRLVSSLPTVRMEAAMDWENTWLTSQHAVPLLAAERWFDFRPGIKGVVIGADGLLGIEDAYWENQP
jgi:hypothetical protein